MKILLEVNENKAEYALEFFKNISFIKKASRFSKNEIKNPSVLKIIDAYENGNEKTTEISLAKLKKLLHA